MAQETGAGRTFANPLELAVGDPFVLRHRGWFYLYGTNDGPPLPGGRMVPVYRSADLLTWEFRGGALEPSEPKSDHWAPEVFAWNGRFFMVVSFGDVENRGHALWVATADGPEGPFRLAKRVSTPAEKFSIDGSYLLDDDGKLYLFRCLDFVEEVDPPHGTGIVVQRMRDPVTPDGPPHTVLRAFAPWQLFEADRVMPLYGGRRFREWTTIEGAAPVKRAGRYFCGYSGGNYGRAYGTGEASADRPLGPYRDLRGKEGPLFATTPGLVEGPGHFSVIQPDGVHDWIVLHGRIPSEGRRRVWLCPANWTAEGVTIGKLSRDPQPAPPLPEVVDRFAGRTGALPEGLDAAGGSWAFDAEGLRCAGGPAALVRRKPELTGNWLVEAYVQLAVPGRAGVEVRPAGGDAAGVGIFLDNWEADGRIIFRDVRAEREPVVPPTLGAEAFAFDRFHAVSVRARGGRAEVRVDGVLLASDLALPPGPCVATLAADGPARFDGVTITRVGA